MSAFCALLILLLAACSGGTTGSTTTTTTTGSSGGGALSGGTDVGGRTLLFEIQSTPSDSFFVPVVNGAKAAAAISGLKETSPRVHSRIPFAMIGLKSGGALGF